MKIAISVPDEVFERADRAAKRLKVSRSRFFSLAAEEYLRTVGEEHITERLNQVYSKEASSLDPVVEAMALEVLRGEEW